MKLQNFVILFLIFQFINILTLNNLSSKSKTLGSPLILIPGFGGCQGYGKLKQNNASSFLIWISLRYFFMPNKITNYFGLNYDPVSRKTNDNDNVSVIFPGWGETWSVENLDNTPHHATIYFGKIVSRLLKNPFYISNQTIRGTPFDFRKGPNELKELNPKLKQLIEETYRNANGSRVVILGHSYGVLLSLDFFKMQSIAWKQKYIKSFIAISGPVAGSIKALKTAVSGDNFDVIFEQSVWYRTIQRSMPSLYIFLPDSRLWPKSEILIQTPTKNYTVDDYEQLFKDINYTNGWEMFKDNRGRLDGFVGPTGISELYCIHGSGLKTASRLVYSPPSFFYRSFPNQNPNLLYEDGDGSVNLRSLQACRNWTNVNYIPLQNSEHVLILQDSRLLSLIEQILNSGDK